MELTYRQVYLKVLQTINKIVETDEGLVKLFNYLAADRVKCIGEMKFKFIEYDGESNFDLSKEENIIIFHGGGLSIRYLKLDSKDTFVWTRYSISAYKFDNARIARAVAAIFNKQGYKCGLKELILDGD